MRRAALFVLAICLAGCAGIKQKTVKPEKAPLLVRQVPFEHLGGWAEDNQSQAVAALRRSCARMLRADPSASLGAEGVAGKYADWHGACLDAENLPDGDDEQARLFLTKRFSLYQVMAGEEKEGLFTGYYEPMLRGSREMKPPYTIPLYGRPADLVAVSLGDFRPELKNEIIYGRIDGGTLKPYFDRKTIEDGALKDSPRVVWVDSPVDAFFLHIQGSGRAQLEDGTVLKIGYAAQNGHPYTAIGAELVRRGALKKEDVSMQSIRDWLESNPAEAAGVMNLNASFVFFREVEGEDASQPATGAEGVPLTEGRSLAVDRRKIPYGVPVWIDVQDPTDVENKRLRRLMVAQDTGGAIRGPIRGDVFWGTGEQAAYMAGIMKSRGKAYVLLPREVAIPENKWYFPWWLEPVDFLLGRNRSAVAE